MLYYIPIFFFVNRYMSILYPLRSVIRRGYTRYIIFVVWFGSALANIPIIIQTEHRQIYINDSESTWVCTSGNI